MIDFKGHRFEREIILMCVRWYLAYPLSYRNLQEMMAERGVQVDHTNIYRWVQKFAPQLEAELRRSGNKRPVGTSWRMDETYIKVNGHWKYLYPAVDKAGQGRPSIAAGHGERKRRPVVRGRRWRVRVTVMAKGPKLTVAGGGYMQSAIRHAVQAFEVAAALRCVERRCDRRTSAAQNKLSPLRESSRQQEPPTGITSANATPRFLLIAHRDKKAALRFLKKAVRQHGLPQKVAIDKSGANTAALASLQEGTGAKIEIRQI